MSTNQPAASNTDSTADNDLNKEINEAIAHADEQLNKAAAVYEKEIQFWKGYRAAMAEIRERSKR